MYHQINTRMYENGSNPGGGEKIVVFIESREEADALLKVEGVREVKSQRFSHGRQFMTTEVYKRKSDRHGKIPVDGGENKGYAQVLELVHKNRSTEIGPIEEIKRMGINDPVYRACRAVDPWRFYYSNKGDWPVGPVCLIHQYQHKKSGELVQMFFAELESKFFIKKFDKKNRILRFSAYDEENAALAEKRFLALAGIEAMSQIACP